MAYPERIVPDETEPGVVAHHLKRYAFAAPECDGRTVLDAGCGVGYGTAYLAERAARAVGVDVDAETVAYARARYGRANVSFERVDLVAEPLPGAPYDVVCAFEVVEHLTDPQSFLERVVEALHDDGSLFVSTPRVERTTHTPANPFHLVEYNRADFEGMLASRFERVEMYGQRRLQTRRHRTLQRLDVLGLRRRFPGLRRAAALVGTPATVDLTLADLVISPEALETATALVAVCRRPRRR